MTLIIEIKRFIDHFCLQVDPLDSACSGTVDVTKSTLVAYLKWHFGDEISFYAQSNSDHRFSGKIRKDFTVESENGHFRFLFKLLHLLQYNESKLRKIR